MFTRIATASLALAAGLALTGCASETTPEGAGDDALTVAVVTPYLGNAATKEVIDLFEEEGKARGWNVSVVDTAGDMNKLNSAFQDAAAQQPDAIVLGMGDPTQLSLGLKSAADAGRPRSTSWLNCTLQRPFANCTNCIPIHVPTSSR